MKLSIIKIVRTSLLCLTLVLLGSLPATAQPDTLTVNGQLLRFNTDSLLHLIVTEGYTPEVQNLNVHYFVDIVDRMPYERQLGEIEKFRRAAKKYHSTRLKYESEFIDNWYFRAPTDSLFRVKVARIDAFIQKMIAAKDVEFELRGRQYICDLHWERNEYARPFKEFPIMDRLLDNISDFNKTGVNGASKKAFNYWFGQCYYQFRDYDKAIHYLKKAIREVSDPLYNPYQLYDETNLRARNALGIYYREAGDLATSDFYFTSMLACPDSVKRRDLCDALGVCGLGYNCLERREYPEAISLLEKGLPVFLRYNNYKTATQASIALGECYLATDRTDAAGRMIDSSKVYIARSDDRDHLALLYPLMSRYYIERGDASRARSYLDSTIVACDGVEKKYSSIVILRAEQDLFAAQQEKTNHEKQAYFTRMIYSIVIAILSILCLIVFIRLYRKKQAAYRVLVKKSLEWADHTPFADELCGNKRADTADVEFMTRVCELVERERLYLDPNITVADLAQRTGVTGAALSKTVNQVMSMNFKSFINEYRIKEAIRVMSVGSDKGSSTMLYFEVGFNDRTSFFRAFKKVTGLSPSDFRKNLQTEE